MSTGERFCEFIFHANPLSSHLVAFSFKEITKVLIRSSQRLGPFRVDIQHGPEHDQEENLTFKDAEQEVEADLVLYVIKLAIGGKHRFISGSLLQVHQSRAVDQDHIESDGSKQIVPQKAV